MKKHFEIILLKIAYLILSRNIDRNIISNRDNDYIVEVSKRLKKIINNIKYEYK